MVVCPMVCPAPVCVALGCDVLGCTMAMTFGRWRGSGPPPAIGLTTGRSSLPALLELGWLAPATIGLVAVPVVVPAFAAAPAGLGQATERAAAGGAAPPSFLTAAFCAAPNGVAGDACAAAADAIGWAGKGAAIAAG